MGLQSALGYRVRRANVAQRFVQRAASSRPGAWVFSRTARHLDGWVLRLSRGRWTLAGAMAGIPVVTVTSTGRRTARARASPLLGVPVGDDLALVGTNFGQAPLPSWYRNLVADPQGRVTYRDRTVDVVARDADGEQRAEVLRAASAIYAGFDAYRERITDRPVPVLVLESAPYEPRS